MLQKTKVEIFTRKKPIDAFSVEILSSSIASELMHCINIKLIESRHESTSFINRLKIFFEVFFLKANVVHVYGDITFAAIGRLSRASIITILDLGTYYRLQGLRKILFYVFWIFLPALIARKIVVISDTVMRELVEIIPIFKYKICVIPCHINPEILKYQNLLRTTREKFTLLHIGSTANKNIRNHINAISGLDIKFIIVGHVDSSILSSLRTLKIDYEIHFDLTVEHLAKLYKQADALLFCSTYEGFGMPIVEAQALGLPVITSSISSMPIVSGGAALLVDPYDTIQIREAINKLIVCPDLKEKLISQGFENAKKYTVEAVSNLYIRLYKEFL